MKLALTLVALFACQSGFAAPTSKSKLTKSPKASKYISHVTPVLGVTVGTLVGGEENFRDESGANAGVLLDFGKKSVVMETGILYRQLGGSVSGGSITLNYLSIPALGKYQIPMTDGHHFYVKGGMIPSILAGSNFSGTLADGDASTANRFEVSAALGLGANFKVSKKAALVFDFTYSRGLISVTEDENLYNSGLGVNAGLAVTL